MCYYILSPGRYSWSTVSVLRPVFPVSHLTHEYPERDLVLKLPMGIFLGRALHGGELGTDRSLALAALLDSRGPAGP